MVLGAFNVSGVIFKPMGSLLNNIFLATWAKLIAIGVAAGVLMAISGTLLKVLESVITPFFI
ncbi:hypothetical protein D3C80_1906970 [compost metagenome]